MIIQPDIREPYLYSLLCAADIPENQLLPKGIQIDMETCQTRYGKLFEQLYELFSPGEVATEFEYWQLPSPFSFAQEDDEASPPEIYPRRLSLERTYLFPESEPPVDTPLLIADFWSMLNQIAADESQDVQAEQLLPLMEQYLATIPVGNSDISYYDLARLTTAALICYVTNQQAGHTTDPEQALFIKGDLSGIQPFIFDVVSRGAAKSLKARSFRVQGIAELAIEYLATQLQLSPANIIFNGGGNFYLLAPAGIAPEPHFAHISEELLQFGQGLQLFLGHVAVNLSELGEKDSIMVRSRSSS